MNDDIRDALLEEQGYVYCPLSYSHVAFCDGDCGSCDIYQEFVAEIEKRNT